MVHITCDLCGKQLGAGHAHHVVKIEVFSAHDPAEITEADLDADHMEEVSQLLEELGDTEDPDELDPVSQQFRYDLCPDCRKRFLRDPLSKEASQKLHFSEN
jgi:hypothetical protein